MEANTIYNAEIADLGLIIKDWLIISDIHIGYEGALNREGIMVPRFQYKKILKRINEIINRYEPKRVIVNGDLKHEFGRITSQEWKESKDFIEYLKTNFLETILIKGNHDHFTRFIAEKTGLDVYDSYNLGGYVVMHGDKLPDDVTLNKSETIIIGHEHPCIGIRNGERLEKIKCYLKGNYHGKNLIVMPSFNFVTEGSDILHEKPLSPLLKNIKTDKFGVYGVENFEVLYFGRIQDIMMVKDKFY